MAGSTAFRSNVEGTILFDNMRPDTNLPLWRRCALVEQGDRHLPDLTVKETMAYAMALRRGIYATEETNDRSYRRRLANKYYKAARGGYAGTREARDSRDIMRKFSKESRDVKASDGDDLAAPADTDYDTSANDTVDQFDSPIAGHDFDENVKYALASLYLTSLSEKKVKTLTPGELRRLSIAEECVIFPSLLLIDEPCTALGLLDESVLVRAFREMVNNNKTVVCTLHQPSKEAFALFDTMLLLSNGYVVYHGPVDGAVDYFISSPCSFDFDPNAYSNPAEFLVDISGEHIPNKDGNYLSRDTLVDFYRTSKLFTELMRRLSELYHSISPLWGGVRYSIAEDSDVANSPARLKHSLAMGARAVSRDSVSSHNHDSDGKDTSAIEAGISDETYQAYRRTPAESGETQAQAHSGNFIVSCCLGFANLFAICATAMANGSNDLCLFLTHANTRKEAIRNAVTLLIRSCLSLWRRQTLFWGILLAQILLALVLSVILGNASGSIYNITSFFAVAALLLMLSSVQLISYIFEMNQHFLKEHSRGMYSSFMFWLMAPIPIYISSVPPVRCFSHLLRIGCFT